jgi:hypothetical protein
LPELIEAGNHFPIQSAGRGIPEVEGELPGVGPGRPGEHPHLPAPGVVVEAAHASSGQVQPVDRRRFWSALAEERCDRSQPHHLRQVAGERRAHAEKELIRARIPREPFQVDRARPDRQSALQRLEEVIGQFHRRPQVRDPGQVPAVSPGGALLG